MTGGMSPAQPPLRMIEFRFITRYEPENSTTPVDMRYPEKGGSAVMLQSLRVLLIRDSEDDGLLIIRNLEETGFHCEWKRVETPQELLNALRDTDWDLVFSDCIMQGFHGHQALSMVREYAPTLPFIIVSASSSEEEAVQSMRAGADDYISLHNLGSLPPAIHRALRNATEGEERGERLNRHKKADRLAQQLRLINRFARNIASILDVDRVQEAALECLRKNFSLSRSRLYIRGLEDFSLFWESDGIADDGNTDSSLYLGENQFELAALRHKVESRPDVTPDSKGKESGNDLLRRFPLLVEDEVVGMLDLISDQPNALDDGDIQILRTMAELIASSLYNSRLYEQVKSQMRQRNEVESSLKATEARYRSFFERDISGDYVATPEGKIIDCNQAFLDIFGFSSKEEALATPTQELYLTCEDRRKFLEELQQKGSIIGRELNYRHQDGNILNTIENCVGNFDPEGKLVSLQGFIVNITEQKKLEANLAQAQKMESIGRLAGGIAHDFNNILQAMMSTTESLKEPGITEENLENGIHNLLQSIHRASKMTRQLLAFSRRQILEVRMVDLNEHIAQTLTMLGRLIGEDLVLNFESAKDTLVIEADPGQLVQILMNLVVNARDATPPGGRITIRCFPWKVDELFRKTRPWVEQTEYVVLEVSDSGMGIEKKILQRIFDPFFTTKEGGKGTGLGLATVYGIVQQHHGAIEVQSEPGEGATFSLFFPRVSDSAVQVTPSGSNPPLGRGELILFAEDEKMVRDALCRGLRAGGYRVLEAGDGEEALRLFREYSGELAAAVLDVVMPGLGGGQVRNEIIRIRPDLPILFSSGYSENAIHDRYVLHEGTNLLRKPYTLGELFGTLRDLIDEKN